MQAWSVSLHVTSFFLPLSFIVNSLQVLVRFRNTTFTYIMLSGALIKLALADEFPFIFISFLLHELFSAVTKMLR